MDDTRQRLLDAAGQTFAAQGFEATTVRDICRRAGANLASVNYYFGDKQRLYIEAVKHAHFHSGAPPLSDLSALATPEQKLEQFVRDMLVKMLDDESPSWHIELIMREMGRPTVACEEVVRSFIGPLFATLTGIVRELLPPTATDQDCHVHAFSVVGQCLMYRFHRPVGKLLISPAEFQRIWNLDLLTQHITGFSLAGLRRHREAGAVGVDAPATRPAGDAASPRECAAAPEPPPFETIEPPGVCDCEPGVFDLPAAKELPS